MRHEFKDYARAALAFEAARRSAGTDVKIASFVECQKRRAKGIKLASEDREQPELPLGAFGRKFKHSPAALVVNLADGVRIAVAAAGRCPIEFAGVIEDQVVAGRCAVPPASEGIEDRFLPCRSAATRELIDYSLAMCTPTRRHSVQATIRSDDGRRTGISAVLPFRKCIEHIGLPRAIRSVELVHSLAVIRDTIQISGGVERQSVIRIGRCSRTKVE